MKVECKYQKLLTVLTKILPSSNVDKFKLELRQTFLTAKLIKCCCRFPREVVAFPLLEICKSKLPASWKGASTLTPSDLVQCRRHCRPQIQWSCGVTKVPPHLWMFLSGKAGISQVDFSASDIFTRPHRPVHGPHFFNQVSIHLVTPAPKYCHLIWGHNDYSRYQCAVPSDTLFLEDRELSLFIFSYYLWFSRTVCCNGSVSYQRSAKWSYGLAWPVMEIEVQPKFLKFRWRCFITVFTFNIFFPYSTCSYANSTPLWFLFIHRPPTLDKRVFWEMGLSTSLWSLPGCVLLYVFMKLGRTQSKQFCFHFPQILTLPMISVCI